MWPRQQGLSAAGTVTNAVFLTSKDMDKAQWLWTGSALPLGLLQQIHSASAPGELGEWGLRPLTSEDVRVNPDTGKGMEISSLYVTQLLQFRVQV